MGRRRELAGLRVLVTGASQGIGRAIALEAAGMVGTAAASLGPAAAAWANRVALLAIGDPSAALDADTTSGRAIASAAGTHALQLTGTEPEPICFPT